MDQEIEDIESELVHIKWLLIWISAKIFIILIVAALIGVKTGVF